MALAEAACSGSLSVGGVLNLTSTGLANHVQFKGRARVSFNQTDTRIQGDAAVAGSLAVSNTLTASRLEATGGCPILPQRQECIVDGYPR